jgi:hypothetical protein
MSKTILSLQPSEALVFSAAATIYAGYISAGKVTDGSEKTWINRSLREAILLATLTDSVIQSDNELG